MFAWLTLLVVFLSWICNVYGLAVISPDTGEEIVVQSLLASEGIRWWLRHVVSNFVGFTPLGVVATFLLGWGIARHSGMWEAYWSRLKSNASSPSVSVLVVILLGMISHTIGEAGCVILLPVAATLFRVTGLSPVAGIVVAYVSMSCSDGSNFLLSSSDSQMVAATQNSLEVAAIDDGRIGPMCNRFFMTASALLTSMVILCITKKKLLPALAVSSENPLLRGEKTLSRRERRACLFSAVAGGVYLLLVLWATFSANGIFRHANGGLDGSPFMQGLVFLYALGLALMGLVYGFVSGRYRRETDVIEGLSHYMGLFTSYVVILFFASQMHACLEYSQMGRCVAVIGTEWLMGIQLEPWGILLLLLLMVAAFNFLVPSSIVGWGSLSLLLVPPMIAMGIAPDEVQCAYRLGESSCCGLSPMGAYLPFVLAYIRQYDKNATYTFLLRHLWRYSLCVLLLWSILFVIWYLCGWPLGF